MGSLSPAKRWAIGIPRAFSSPGAETVGDQPCGKAELLETCETRPRIAARVANDCGAKRQEQRFTLVDQATHGECCQDIARQAIYEWIPDVGASYSSWLHMYDTLFSGVVIYNSHASKKKQYRATPQLQSTLLS